MFRSSPARSHAEVAELADALASGASGSNPIGVQIPASAPFDSPWRPAFGEPPGSLMASHVMSNARLSNLTFGTRASTIVADRQRRWHRRLMAWVYNCHAAMTRFASETADLPGRISIPTRLQERRRPCRAVAEPSYSLLRIDEICRGERLPAARTEVAPTGCERRSRISRTR